ncbi:thiamine pyrophosphate-binding protein [Sedimentibacter sp. MB31-C6]|uniref:thiamine pyrophosphate-binding protein n=1 Tax=Sedimentibacter sp. MB31-C6 TaxID=3109366 RepID=UPI002DDD5687|nr:thiamine pyrophosphate-binding protein [Sedimentibacter sp. MB36-C1]WSI04803.1 thiamine pyrophosphate-binding protein [Sedimentibacter sp. MB36-C1]
MKRFISEQMVEYLERRNTEYVFGLCGHTLIGFLDALSRSRKIKYISFRNEQLAAMAADGYARIKKKAGVVLCHLGPGLANAVTGVANASFDSIPMVVIAGDVPRYYYGKHPHQEVNLHSDASQYEILKPIVKRVWRIDDAEALPEILDKAFRLAESGRPGPVLISIPMDVFSTEIEEELFARTFKDSFETIKPALAPSAAKAIAKKLIEAKNPVIHAGGGILLAEASMELQKLIEFLDIPVSRTLMGQGCISDTHPLMLGQTGFWGIEFTHRFTANADVLLGLGTRFAEADSSSWYTGVTFDMNKTEFLQIDIDPAEIGRNYPVAIGAIADLKLALTQILEEAKILLPEGIDRPELRKIIKVNRTQFKESNIEISEDGRFPMTPQRILKDVKAVIPEDAIIFTDVGWNKNGVAQQFDITIPGTIHHSSGLATMGFGGSALIGGKLAAPDKVVLTLVGDGGFGVNPGALATAVEQNIPVVWVVMNNSAFGTIAGLEYANYKTKFGTVFTMPDGKPYSPNWAEVAKAYGVDAIKIKSADDFKPELKKAISCNKPYLLDVPMENIVVPTPGCWNINDIYIPKPGIVNGKLLKNEKGEYQPPNHSVSHK